MLEQDKKVQEILEASDKANREVLKQLIDAGATPHCLSNYINAVGSITLCDTAPFYLSRPLAGGGITGSAGRFVGLGSLNSEKIKGIKKNLEEEIFRFQDSID